MPCGLSDILRGLPIVEQIVRDLERHADGMPIERHALRICRTHAADHAAEFTADLKEVRRLFTNALIVCILARGHLIGCVILENLTLAQRTDELRELDVD